MQQFLRAKPLGLVSISPFCSGQRTPCLFKEGLIAFFVFVFLNYITTVMLFTVVITAVYSCLQLFTVVYSCNYSFGSTNLFHSSIATRHAVLMSKVLINIRQGSQPLRFYPNHVGVGFNIKRVTWMDLLETCHSL